MFLLYKSICPVFGEKWTYSNGHLFFLFPFFSVLLSSNIRNCDISETAKPIYTKFNRVCYWAWENAIVVKKIALALRVTLQWGLA